MKLLTLIALVLAVAFPAHAGTVVMTTAEITKDIVLHSADVIVPAIKSAFFSLTH